jgi:hypothetical protein
MKVLDLHKGAVLDNKDLPVRRNDLGVRGIFRKIFFKGRNIFNGLYVRVDELPFIVSNEQVLAALPKNERHLNRQFPVDTYNKYRKTTA